MLDKLRLFKRKKAKLAIMILIQDWY